MLTVAPMIKNLSSTAGSLLDKHNTRDLFFSSSEPASPFQASSGPHNQQEQQEKQALSPFHQQRGSFLSDEACRLVNMPPPPSSSAPPPSSDTYNTVHYGQQPLQNHIKTAVTYPHVPSSQDTTENQEEQPQPPGPIKALKAEQTTEQSSHTDIVEPKDVKPLGRPKRGNRERSLLGIPQSTSGSTSELSSSSLSLQSLSSSGSSSTSQSKEGTTRRMLLRGVHKKLSVLPGSNTADITRTHSTPPIEKSTIVLTDSSTNSQASPAILNKDTSALSNTSSLGEDSGPDSVLGRLPIGDQTPLSSTVNSGVSLPARKAQVGSPATGSRASSLSLEHYQIMDDDGCTDAGPKGTKRRANTPVPFAAPPRNNGSRRRTSSPGEDTTKKLKVHDHRNNGKLLTHSPKTASNGLQGRERRPNFPKGLFSVTGDEYALKHNNDYCESCLGLGQFICCDSCPRAFHFSCCQPPVDPNNLPDEWNCKECRTKTCPPKPHAPGIFKQLLDNLDLVNPRSFALPAELRTFFRGVETNSDGDYVDTLDYKPSECTTGHGPQSSSSVADDPLQLRDKHGEIRLCFHCSKSAYGGRMMISCEHCPLHWHLDCLDPPLASRPPTTRKWMCPNHAEHVMPRRRKRRDAIPVRLDDPFAPNDGDIDIIEEPSPPLRTSRVKSTLIDDPSGAIFKVPEMSVKLGFLAKCHRLQQQQQTDAEIISQEYHSSQKFELLIAAVMACEGMDTDTSQKTEGERMAQDEGRDEESESQGHQDRRNTRAHKKRKEETNNDNGNIGVSYEMVQDAVLAKLSDPEERAAYSRFRTLQRVVCEKGFEASVQQWSEVQMRIEQGQERGQEPLEQPQPHQSASASASITC